MEKKWWKVVEWSYDTHKKYLFLYFFFQNHLIITHRLIHKKRPFSYFALPIIVDIKSFIHLNIYVKAISLTDYRSKHERVLHEKCLAKYCNQ